MVKKEILVNKAEVRHANIDGIKAFIDSFPDSEENESVEPFAYSVKVKHIIVDVEPFEEQNIMFKAVGLEANDVFYSDDEIQLTKFELNIDSNISKLILDASLDEGKVVVKKLTLKEFDTLALETLLRTDDTESNETITEDDSTPNPLIPKTVSIESFHIDILPRTFDPVNIESLDVDIHTGVFDVETLVLKKAKVTLKGSTNLSTVQYDANIKDNVLSGMLKLTPMDTLFSLYDLPVRKAAIGDIVMELTVSEEEVVATLDTQMKQLLKTEKDGFNLDVESLKSNLVYDINSSKLGVDTKAIVTTPYAENIAINNLFRYDTNISYSGEMSAKKIIGVDAKFTKPLQNLHLTYRGNDQSIHTDLNADNLQGTFISHDFEVANLHLETRKAIEVRELFELPSELNQTKAQVSLDMPISFDANASYVAHAKISSNVANIDANVSYKDTLEIKSVIDIPKTSLLRPYSEELKWDSINPVSVDAILLDDAVDARLKAGTLSSTMKYNIESTHIDGNIILGGLKADISGIAKEKIGMNMQINAMASLIESIESLYVLGDVPVVKGSANVLLEVDAMKKANLILSSPHITYEPDHKTVHDIEDIDLEVGLTESEIVLNKYKLTFAKQKIFATKPSKIIFNDDVVNMNELWINDDLKVDGNYSLKTKKGTINAGAKALHLVHEIIDFDSDIDIKTVLDGNRTSVKGKVILLGGDIKYDMAQKTFASDSDILIVQDMKENEPSTFMDNLSAEIQVQTKKPLVYKRGNINMKANVDLGIHKTEQSDLMVLGSVELLKGGSYIFEGKKFVLDKSFVYFTGNPNKPLLEVTVNYESLNHFITVFITGTADRPNINFSSKPSLTKEQILSVILFDSEAGAGTNSGDDMMKMMGGAMAKSALNDLGVKVDHLVLGAGNSVEIGRKLTDEITIIYVNDIISSVKLKYEHSRHMESVISAGEESQSYDIIYKNDF